MIEQAEFGTTSGVADPFPSSEVLAEIGVLYCEQKISVSSEKAQKFLTHLTDNKFAKAACVLTRKYIKEEKYNEAIKWMAVAVSNYKESANQQDLIEAMSLKVLIAGTLSHFDKLKEESLLDDQGLYEISMIYREPKIFDPDYMKALTYKPTSRHLFAGSMINREEH